MENAFAWFVLAYGVLGYWHFRAVLRALEPRDSTGTALLNAGLALLVGPLLLALASPFILSYRIERYQFFGRI